MKRYLRAVEIVSASDARQALGGHKGRQAAVAASDGQQDNGRLSDRSFPRHGSRTKAVARSVGPSKKALEHEFAPFC